MTENSTAAPTAAKKPATRRKKATGPTKPAALKKLGLTQEDLDLLAQVKDARANAQAHPVKTVGDDRRKEIIEEPKLDKVDGEELTNETKQQARIAYPTRPDNIDTGGWTPQPQEPTQIDAKLKVYQTLKDAGLAIPEDIRVEVETYVAQRAQTEKPATVGPWFARNLRGVEFRMRLERQKSGTKSTLLKPRGQRGDLVKLQPEDLEDDNLIANVEYGIIEIIPLQEAKDVIAKQSTNAQKAVHPAMALIRNELGEEYGYKDADGNFHKQESVQVVGDNSYTVAHLQPQGGEAGNIPDQGRGIDWNAARSGQQPQTPQQRQAAPSIGNPAIFSDGFTDNATAAQADEIARRKDIEGPAAGLGGLNVSVTEVQRG